MKRFLLLCIAFIVFLTTPLLHAAEVEEHSDHGSTLQEILILNSYHPGYAWSDDQQAGIVDVFQAKDKHWIPVIEYLDLRRLSDGRHLTELKRLFRLKYQNKKFSVVIAMDNPALEFAVDNQAGLFGNAPIVFCGINNFTPSLLKGRSEVTGIAEAIDIAGTIEVMLRLHPAAQEIFSPQDYTTTGLAIRKELEALVPRFGARVRFRFTDPLTMEELLKELERLPKNSLVLEIGFITDKSGRTFDISETTKLFSEHSPVPIYSTYEQRLGFGIVGGRLLSARIHGANAARIALRVLAGEKASAIPVVLENDSQFMFDYKVMKRFGIHLSALPEHSTVINKPVSLYAAHRVVIQTALGIIVFLAVVIALLTINIIQRRRSTIALREQAHMNQILLDSFPCVALLMRPKTRVIVAMNKAAREAGCLFGSTCFGSWPKFEKPCPWCLADRLWAEGKEQYTEVDALGIIWDAHWIPVSDDLYLHYAFDITERKRVEEALRRTESNFRLSLDDSPLGVRIVTEEGETVYANRAILDIYGYDSIEELNTTPEKKRYTPESYAEFQIRREKRKRGDYGPSEYEVSIVRKDGEVRQLQVFRKIILWNGESQFQVIYQDITERKRAEEEKRRIEERSRKVVEDIFRFIPEGVLVFTRKMELLRQNQAFRELVSGYAKRLGFAEDELENLIVDEIKAAMGDKNIKEIRISRKHETGEHT